ncbi:hypothetical protein [Microvirgula aerodenitrificans]|uniref:hypothetical protein n=1 Tax=Microvirgula aerodenitrificans TaxID=57480 RepID=UPI0028E6F142|nr:hypothetical protein [Microvirgula aerodenitrificans]
MAQYLSKSGFAASQGWSPSYVTKLLTSGRLVLAPDGKRVDVDATLSRIGKTADPAKAGVQKRHEQHRIQRDVYGSLNPGTSSSGGNGNDNDFHHNRAEKEKHLARLARIEADKAEAMTVDRQGVHDAAYRYSRLLRDTLLGLPRQISSDLAAITDPWELEQVLTARLRQSLNDMARIGADDLKKVTPDHVRQRIYRLPGRLLCGPDPGPGPVGGRMG